MSAATCGSNLNEHPRISLRSSGLRLPRLLHPGSGAEGSTLKYGCIPSLNCAGCRGRLSTSDDIRRDTMKMRIHWIVILCLVAGGVMRIEPGAAQAQQQQATAVLPSDKELDALLAAKKWNEIGAASSL